MDMVTGLAFPTIGPLEYRKSTSGHCTHLVHHDPSLKRIMLKHLKGNGYIHLPKKKKMILYN